MSARILLEHERAKEFFEQTMHPDLDELRRRDAAIAKMNAECPIRVEGTSIIVDIPDIDIASIIGR